MDSFRSGVNLLAAGVSDKDLRRLRRARRIAAVRPGAYVVGSVDPAMDRHTSL